MNKLLEYTYKICFIFIILITLLALFMSSQDYDMFFLIANGKDILKGNWTTISTNLKDIHIISQQWLYSIILVQVDKFGYIGHITFVIIQDIILVGLTGYLLYNKTHNLKISIISPILGIIICSPYLINIRPQIITMILLISEIIILEKFKTTNNYKTLLYMIPILILSANFHSSVYLYHIYIALPYCIDKIDNKYKMNWKLFSISIMSIIFNICTPYGIYSFTYIFKSSIALTNIKPIMTSMELVPLNMKTMLGIFIILQILCLIYYRNHIDIKTYYYTITSIILTMFTYRQLYLLYIGFIFMVISLHKTMNYYFKLIFILFMTLLCVKLCNSTDEMYDITKNDTGGTIINIDDYINKDDTILSYIDISNYLEYKEYKVHSDCRFELYGKPLNEVNDLYLQSLIIRGTYNIKDDKFITQDKFIDEIKDYNVIILSNSCIGNILLKDTQYKQVYNTKYYTIWRKN